MIKPIVITRWPGWRPVLRGFLGVQGGFALLGLSIDVLVQANLGTSSWIVLEKGLTNYIPITLGQATIGVAVLVTLVDVLLQQPLGWGTLANAFFIGMWVDWLRPVVTAFDVAWWWRLAYLLLGVSIMGLATAV